MSVQPIQNGEESFNNQKQKIQGGRPSTYQIKMPELQFMNSESPNANFQLQVCRLVQANAILTLEKYNLSEKIHVVIEQIKRLQAKNAVK